MLEVPEELRYIRGLIAQDQYIISQHAQERMAERSISEACVLEVAQSGVYEGSGSSGAFNVRGRVMRTHNQTDDLTVAVALKKVKRTGQVVCIVTAFWNNDQNWNWRTR